MSAQHDPLIREMIEAQTAATGHKDEHGIGAVIMREERGEPTYKSEYFDSTDHLTEWLCRTENETAEVVFACSRGTAEKMSRYYTTAVKTFQL